MGGGGEGEVVRSGGEVVRSGGGGEVVRSGGEVVRSVCRLSMQRGVHEN